MSANKAKICIVGAGPAGLGAALAFYNSGYTNVSVYERRQDISKQEIEESYPIGVNTRGKRALKALLMGIDENLGNVVSSWDIYVTKYSINVASFKSGTVASTTRSIVVNVLLKYVQEKGIPIHYSHAVTRADSNKKTVTFETASGIKSIACDALIVADGYQSRARQDLEKQSDTLQVRQWKWPLTFRVLVSDKPEAQELDPSVHYIFNSIYAAELRDGRWTVVMAKKSEDEAFLLSKKATDQNISKLKAHLKAKAPMVSNMFSDQELCNYFGRSSFAGATTWVSELVVNNWAVLIGDAAHSPYPATGEGVNASLEDAFVLQQVLQDSRDNASLAETLSTFGKKRLKDSQALSTIAYSLVRPSKKEIVQKVALKATCGCLSGSKELGTGSIQELLFGPSTDTRILSYSQIVNEWDQQLKWVGGCPRIPPEDS